MRLFIALELPEGVKGSIASWTEPLRKRNPGLKWCGPENLHVTLRFLGNVDPDEVALRIGRMRLERCLPVDFTLETAGTFGRPPSVLWLSGDFSRGVYIAADLLAGIPDENGAPEGRKFFPHVTVARARKGDSLQAAQPGTKIQGSSSRISLFSSTLTPSGPLYSTLFTAGR